MSHSSAEVAVEWGEWVLEGVAKPTPNVHEACKELQQKAAEAAQRATCSAGCTECTAANSSHAEREAEGMCKQVRRKGCL